MPQPPHGHVLHRHMRTIREVRTLVTRVITDVYYVDGTEVERKVTEVIHTHTVGPCGKFLSVEKLPRLSTSTSTTPFLCIQQLHLVFFHLFIRRQKNKVRSESLESVSFSTMSLLFNLSPLI